MIYTNPPLDIPALLSVLKNKGLKITDERKAEKFLENVSYFRFDAYLRPMEQPGMPKYKADASFDKAISLYEFDSKLRLLIFSAIQTIEVSLRSKIINRFSLAHGAFWFMNPDMAVDKHKFTENLGHWKGNSSVQKMILSRNITINTEKRDTLLRGNY